MNMLDHLAERNLQPSKYNGVFLDECSATFLLWNLSGELVGYQTYCPSKPKNHGKTPREQRYFTFVSRQDRQVKLAVWGMESYKTYEPLYLVEGIFDACRLHNLGFSCVAVLGNNPEHLKSWLDTLPNKKVAVCQGDSAGKVLARYGDEAIYLPLDKDCGDLSDSELLTLLK